MPAATYSDKEEVEAKRNLFTILEVSKDDLNETEVAKKDINLGSGGKIPLVYDKVDLQVNSLLDRIELSDSDFNC